LKEKKTCGNYYYGPNSSRKKAINDIIHYIQNKNGSGLDILQPYVIGAYEIGKTETIKFAIGKCLPDKNFKIFEFGHHETKYSLLDIYEKIITNAFKIFAVENDANELLNIYNASNTNVDDKEYKNKFKEINKDVLTILNRNYPLISNVIEAKKNFLIDTNDEIKKATLLSTIKKLLGSTSELKQFFIVSEPQIGFIDEQNSKKSITEILTKDNRSIFIIKEGRFCLNNIKVTDPKYKYYKFIEINSMSYNECCAYISDRNGQQYDTIKASELISKIGLHIGCIIRACFGLNNNSYEKIENELIEYIDSIVNKTDNQYIIKDLFYNQNFDELCKLGFVYPNNVFPVCIRKWYKSYTPHNVFISYPLNCKEEVHNIVEELKNNASHINIRLDIEISYGDNCLKWIDKNLKKSKTAIIFYGETVGGHQEKEIEFFANKDADKGSSINIIPVVLKSCQNGPPIHAYFSGIRRIDLRIQPIEELFVLFHPKK